jgi:hypothetical protein
MPITKGKIHLPIANHEFPIRLVPANPPPVSRANIVIILVHGISLTKPEEAHLSFDPDMIPQVEIQKTADPIKTVGSVVGAEVGEDSACH